MIRKGSWVRVVRDNGTGRPSLVGRVGTVTTEPAVTLRDFEPECLVTLDTADDSRDGRWRFPISFLEEIEA